MRFYELLYIARSDLTSTQVDSLNNTINTIITGGEEASEPTGNVVRLESWGVKSLPYKSKKLRKNKGYFNLTYFSLNNLEVLKELQNKLKLNEAVLRVMINQIDNIPEPKAINKDKAVAV